MTSLINSFKFGNIFGIAAGAGAPGAGAAGHEPLPYRGECAAVHCGVVRAQELYARRV